MLFILYFSSSFGQKSNPFLDSIIPIIQKQEYSLQISTLREGIELNSNSNFDNAIELARFGLELTKEKNDIQNKGEFLSNIGAAYVKKGNLDSASTYYYFALGVLEKSPYHKELADLYDNLARMYRKLQEPKRAIAFYDKALAIYTNNKDREGIARINNESGIVYQDMGDLETSFERFSTSLKIQQERNDSIGISYAYDFLGQNMSLREKYDQAKIYFEDALKIREKLGDQFAIMLSYTSLGEVYKQLKQYQLSIDYFKKSNEMAEKINYLDIQAYNYSQMQDNSVNLNDYKSAYEYLTANNLIQDSLYNLDKLRAVEEISTKYQTVEHERTILEQRAKLIEGRIYMIALAFLILLSIGIAYFFIFRQKQRHKQFRNETELNEAKLKLEAVKKVQDERLRISRDLHDNIGAQLAFIISAVDNLSYAIDDKVGMVHRKLGSIKDFVSGTIGELRDTIWAMNLTNIRMEDLKARIANYITNAKRFHEQTNISLKFDENLSDNIEFSNLHGLNIYRIIQEAVNNSLKYAAAENIIVEVSLHSDNLQFTITDDGKGFDQDEVELGNGLNNMNKRAIDLNSHLRFESEIGKGTTIQFEMKI